MMSAAPREPRRVRRSERRPLMRETASFERCGQCDNCKAAKLHAGDTQRDFRAEVTSCKLQVTYGGGDKLQVIS